jgi:cobalt-zinc-cadmium efflux system protein
MKHTDYHIRTKSNKEHVIKLSVVILLVFVIIELVGAYISNSLALFGDAMHLLTDAFALIITLFGFWLSRKPPTDTYSYGFMRSEVIAAFVNAILWFGIFAYIIYEVVHRMLYVEDVDPLTMLPIAVAGLIVNLIIFKILHSEHDHDNINMRGAILHVLMDILGSIGAIIGGIIIYFTGWMYADPIVSVILASLILRSGWKLLEDCVRIMLMGKPDSIKVDEVEKAILRNVEDVKEMHHMHIWELASGQMALTAHVVMISGGNCNDTIWATKRILIDQFNIIHSTIQVEHDECPDEELYYEIYSS